MKVAEYIEHFLTANGINQVFTVVGGGAMYLNDTFGHSKSLKCVYHHHEQAAAMAAEAYYRVDNKMAVVCVTSGPGATNAITGVAGAWMDSIPMLVISGQTKLNLTVRHSGLNLRTLGNQEIDIISIVSSITKYSVMVENPKDIRRILEEAYYSAISGRPGPSWIDIPLDIQNMEINPEELAAYEQKADMPDVSDEDISFIYDRIQNSDRPVIYAGSAIRISGSYKEFTELVQKLKIPVVTCWNSIDEMPSDSRYYAGRAGIMGNRFGNFAVQNSDLVISLGCRLNIYQVGYDCSTWAREAYCIAVDIDPLELEKPTIRVDKKICADVGSVIHKLTMEVEKRGQKDFTDWIKQCNLWKQKYPVVLKRHYDLAQSATNVYAFIDALSKRIPDNGITVVANGSASVVGSQSYWIKEGQRFIMNCAMSSMGYELPAAIGAAAAARKPVICIAGDGSIQMNIQELQTIQTNRLPVKIVLINNEGYQQIRLTQKNLFNGEYVGVGKESGDLEFPDFSKVADLYGFKYISCKNNSEIDETVTEFLNYPNAIFCEVFVTKEQIFEPKSATKRLGNGKLFSPPLEDMAPFLTREELKSNMLIDLIDK